MPKDRTTQTKVRCAHAHRAFSLVELLAVLTIFALIVTAGMLRFGSGTLDNMEADAYVRRLTRDLQYARRRTISTGDNHYLSVTLDGSDVASYTLIRRAAGGDAAVDEPRGTPDGLTVAASHTALEFDFDGSALAGYSITVAGPSRSYALTTVAATGTVAVTDTTP
ncbi:MAG: hypothetical protein CMJ58_09570 [Planctomycetaceae bacterium]|nr:hypothetical protein [Planctomycetaceae bacterium]